MERKPFNLVPLGDIQYGALGFADTAFKDYLKYIRDNFDEPWYLGMGDYVDAASPSNRKNLAAAGLYDDTRRQLDETADRKIDELMTLLGPTQGRWLGLLSGHHYWPFMDGTTSDEKLATYLSAPFLKRCALIDVGVLRNDGNLRGTIRIWAHHGAQGSAQAAAGGLAKLNKLVGHFPDTDIFLMGHYHEVMSRIYTRLVRVGPRLVARPAVLGITGSWLRGYLPGKTNYAEDRAYAPLAIGGLTIQVDPKINTYGLFAPVYSVQSRS